MFRKIHIHKVKKFSAIINKFCKHSVGVKQQGKAVNEPFGLWSSYHPQEDKNIIGKISQCVILMIWLCLNCVGRIQRLCFKFYFFQLQQTLF